jgi:MFS transporter, ACS family, aldohexuronate transporter
MRIVARALPPRDRPLGNGIFTSGTSIGALIAPSLILGIAGALGWRWAFAAVASFGLLWLAVWIWFTKDPLFSNIWSGPASPCHSAASAYGDILRHPQFWRVFAVTILVNPCLYFNVNWLPVYFAQQRGLQPGRQMGVALTLIFLGLDLGYLACGFGVRWLARRASIPVARRPVFLAASAMMSVSALVPRIPGPQAAVAALMVVNFAVGIWIAMYLTMAQEVSAENVSAAAGLLGGSGSLSGALAMWAVGSVTQQTGSFAAPLAAISVAGLLAAGAGLAVTARAGSPA